MVSFEEVLMFLLKKNSIVFKNAFWMMSEKVISIAGVFLVGSFVAKYVGPLIWGEIALAIVFFQVVQTVSQMGGDNILFRRMSKNKISGIRLMKSTSIVRLLIYIFFSSLLFVYFNYYSNGGLSVYFIAVAISYLFSSVDVLSIYYNAILRSKINTLCNVIGLVVSLCVRYGIALFEFKPEYLAIPIVLNTLIPFLIRLYLYYREPKHPSVFISNSKHVIRYSKYMVFSGFSIVLASLSIAVYTRVNQVILDNVEGTSSVGIYSIAATIGSSWVFVSQALITSFYTKIYAESNEEKVESMVAKLNRMVLAISLCFVMIVSVFGKAALSYLYGEAYSSAYIPMIILSLASLVSALGTISYRFIIKHSGFSFLSKKMATLLFLSIPISYVFIVNYGLIGAAYSSLIIEVLSLTVLNYFYKHGLVFNIHKQTFFRCRG